MSKQKRPVRSAIVQDSGGNIRVTIPNDVAEVIDIDADDTVLIRPEGDDEVVIRSAGAVFSDEHPDGG